MFLLRSFSPQSLRVLELSNPLALHESHRRKSLTEIAQWLSQQSGCNTLYYNSLQKMARAGQFKG